MNRGVAMFRHAQSGATDTAEAMSEILAALPCAELALVILFVGEGHDLRAIETALTALSPKLPVMGCTTAGEIGNGGYLDGHIVAIGLPRDLFRVAVGHIPGLRNFKPEQARDLAFELRAELTFSTADWSNEVAFLLTDGLSLMEDQLVWALSEALSQSPLVGGSAGDGLRFGQTHVLYQGRFITDAAVLAVLRTPCTVTAFRFDHLEPTEMRMVVTDADPEQRLVRQINGMPAGPEYARLLGKDPQHLSPFIFAANPVVSKIGDHHHVLAIQRVEPDGTLRFFSAVEPGLVLRLATSVDLVAHLESQLAGLAGNGPLPAILACDCILRRLEAENTQQRRNISDVLDRYQVAGFNTYGEQFNLVHVNQTFTGLAFHLPQPDSETLSFVTSGVADA
ncbi:FIST N-terminal domain-containing protein [Roseinatronobacter alkalisoli]|uniref:FIST N-terminal domain-containing protein n=1 Tax=Roseinatronobacter alkalisoli TaxID=3028235 RepID=A0ABT5T4F3_9RHOB|nr:FIST N-terminal domain-containing protein [Roseinatronobacter sp. HJB301]MDD7970005.1 FIST N-terminal domain-containing protein [Roseinatronobacter sp. HJB301]